jgi:streptogramin lyase
MDARTAQAVKGGGNVIPGYAGRYMAMRALLVGALLLTTIGCGSQTGSVSPQPSPTSIATITPTSSPASSPAASPRPDPSPIPNGVVGGVVEYPTVRAGASLWDLIVGPDGNIWFVDDPNKLGRVTPAGVVTEFTVPHTGSIAVGPDDNLWMAATDGWVMKISPAGVVNSFRVPGADGGGITAGPDGNIWFTEDETRAIGRMSTQGVLLNEFPITNPNGAPRSIVSGPDGNLWFLDDSPQGSAIGRITTSGTVTEFPMVRSNEGNQLSLTSIVVGPDQNLWFTEAMGGQMGRITPAGVITELPLLGASPWGLTVGPDGNLWFTTAGSFVGRMSTTGKVRYFALPNRVAESRGIALGGDGRIWFTESNRVASIGEIVPELNLSTRLLTLGTEAAPATRALTLTSSGEAAVAISSVTLAGSAAVAMRVNRDTCSGRTLAVGASCQIELAVTPTPGQGVVTGQLRIPDNASGSPQVVSVVAQLPDCRLRVFSGSESKVQQGGFLNFRTGVVEPDPTSVFTYDGLYHSKASPTLTGNVVPLYDSVAGRWLPAPAWWISPDHTRYTYVTSTATYVSVVHVVDVATGRDRKLNLGAAPWSVLGFGSNGIYLHQSYESIGPGLFVVSPDTGVTRQLFATGAVFQVADGAAWIGSNHDPRLEIGIAGSYDKVWRRDLATGKSVLWFYAKDAELYALSIGGGRVLVFGRSSTWLLSGPNKAERLTAPGSGADVSVAAWASDSSGVWLGGNGGLYLWRPEAGLAQVSETAASPAGACA